MADINGPAIKNEVIEELMGSVRNPQDLLGEESLLKQLTAHLLEKPHQGG